MPCLSRQALRPLPCYVSWKFCHSSTRAGTNAPVQHKTALCAYSTAVHNRLQSGQDTMWCKTCSFSPGHCGILARVADT